MPVRCAVLPPVPVPYREPLFAGLAERGRVAPRVIYLAGGQPGWDMRADWFPERHDYDSEVLSSRQRARAGRSPVTMPRGLGAALRRARPDCVVSWEYGPATWRALAWCALHRRPLVIFSELTPWSDAALSTTQLHVHRLVAPRAAGFIVASSQGVLRLDRMGIDPARVHVSLQSADLGAYAGPPRPVRSGPVRVLAVGRLVPDKNLGRLIDAFARAGFGPGEAELVVCGSGPLEHELRAHAERVGVPVRFPGYVAPGDLGRVYAEADALALVSTYEPFGVAVRELLAAGSRAVTARHPAEADAEAWEDAVLQAAGERPR